MRERFAFEPTARGPLVFGHAETQREFRHKARADLKSSDKTREKNRLEQDTADERAT